MATQYRIATDAETGSLKPKEGDLLTIYVAVVDENDKILEDLDLLLKPDNGRLPIADADALKKNGINLQEHLANPNTITYGDAKKLIVTMLKKYREPGKYRNQKLYGFNVRFDRDFIKEYLLNDEEYDNLLHYKVVDVADGVDFLKRCGWMPPSIGTLVSCVEHFQVPLGKAHTAKDDVLMTIEVDKRIMALMESKKNNSGGNQGLDLVSLLEAE
jgi:oligoribonuclease (3'-5' exoribonuclease)